MRFFQTLVFCLMCSFLNGQITFTESSDRLRMLNFSSGVAIGIADMNGDGLDDIVRLKEGKDLYYEIQTDLATPFFQYRVDHNLTSAPFWNIAIGDIDNDGQNDCMMSGTINVAKVVQNETGLENFRISDIPDSDVYAQGSNFVDVNNDGFLDAFICDDNGVSRLYINNGDSTFTYDPNIIDLTTLPPSDNSGNYASIWTDFDSDGDIDLYIAKCRAGVDSNSDPRRINMLFENQGNGTYIESAAKYGLAIGAQSWTADFGDIDNDGDQDCFLTNHDVPCMILENRGDSIFMNISQSAGIDISGAILQGSFSDFDNNGFLDILISGGQDRLYFNNGDLTFSAADDFIFGSDIISSFSLGDLNNDGFKDIYAAYATGINVPSNQRDRIWMNNGNENHWIKFDLEGKISNRNGVGAKVQLFGAWGQQSREVRAGEGYGISLSHLVHFGLGSELSVDSVVINWPMGSRELYTDVQVDQQYLVQEGGCISSRISLLDDYAVLCGEETKILEAPEGYASYLWSNGDTTRVIEIQATGIYYVRMKTDAGCDVLSTAASIEFNPEIVNRNLILDKLPIVCAGTNIEILAPFATQYIWNTGDTSRSVLVTAEGAYFATLIGHCDTISSDTVMLNVLKPETIEVKGDTIEADENAMLTSTSEQTRWYESLNSEIPLFEGDTFITPSIDMSTIYFAAPFTVSEEGEQQQVGQMSHTGNSFYNNNNVNGALIFDVKEKLIIQEVTVFTEFPGRRIITILDNIFQEVYRSDTLMISDTVTIVSLNATIGVGDGYRISTDQNLNNLEFGVNNPRLYRSDKEVSYPFEIPLLISIKESSAGEDFFYYFYDWKVTSAPMECEGERIQVDAIVDDISNIRPQVSKDLARMYPNPSMQILNIEFIDKRSSTDIQILDIYGNRMRLGSVESTSNGARIDISSLTNGIYFATINSGDQTQTLKFLKVD